MLLNKVKLVYSKSDYQSFSVLGMTEKEKGRSGGRQKRGEAEKGRGVEGEKDKRAEEQRRKGGEGKWGRER